jgi:hypothetical protein
MLFSGGISLVGQLGQLGRSFIHVKAWDHAMQALRITKHGWLDNPLFIGDVSIQTPVGET